MSMQFKQADYVVLIVADLDRAITFYTEILGLSLAHRSGPFAQLDTGATRVAFYQRDAMSETLGFEIAEPDRTRPGFELGFKTDDVDTAYAWLIEQGVEGVTEPTTRPWGQRTAYVYDPDGHLVELAQDLRDQPVDAPINRPSA